MAQRWLGASVLLAACFLLAGCGGTLGGSQLQTPGTQITASSGATNTNSVAETPLRQGDRVKVEFSGNANSPPSHEEEIKDDGNITLGHIGAVQAAGKTPRELQQEIHSKYVPDYFVKLTVTVTPSLRFYFVGGEVRSPDRHQYLGPTTVTRAIQASGDFTNFARKNRVKLIRASGAVEVIDCDSILNGHADLDPPVYPGDSIVVPRRFW